MQVTPHFAGARLIPEREARHLQERLAERPQQDVFVFAKPFELEGYEGPQYLEFTDDHDGDDALLMQGRNSLQEEILAEIKENDAEIKELPVAADSAIHAFGEIETINAEYDYAFDAILAAERRGKVTAEDAAKLREQARMRRNEAFKGLNLNETARHEIEYRAIHQYDGQMDEIGRAELAGKIEPTEAMERRRGAWHHRNSAIESLYEYEMAVAGFAPASGMIVVPSAPGALDALLNGKDDK